MRTNNVVEQKSFAFAARIIKVHQYLTNFKKEYVLSKQLLRSGTSIGANIEEAIGGQSEKEFYSKITISYKECRETKYWIGLLSGAKYLTKVQSDSLLADTEELLRIIGSIQRTVREKLRKKK